jgi:hypothetical protein
MMSVTEVIYPSFFKQKESLEAFCADRNITRKLEKVSHNVKQEHIYFFLFHPDSLSDDLEVKQVPFATYIHIFYLLMMGYKWARNM